MLAACELAERQGLQLPHHRGEERGQPRARIDRLGAEPVRAAQLFGQRALADLEHRQLVGGAIAEPIGLVAALDDEAAGVAADAAPELVELDRAAARDGDEVILFGRRGDVAGVTLVMQRLGLEPRQRHRPDLAPLELAAEAVGIAERQVQGKIGVRDHPLPLGGAMGRVGSGRAIGSRLHPPSPKRGETSCRAPGRPIKNFSCRPRAGARIDKSGRARRQIRALRARIVKQSLTSLQARRTRSRQSGGIRTGALHAGRHGRKHHAQTQCRSDHPVGGPRRP